ncbi:MAG: hypothetical protein WCX71_03900 [Candidatus Buchananbacteria bacterium]
MDSKRESVRFESSPDEETKNYDAIFEQLDSAVNELEMPPSNLLKVDGENKQEVNELFDYNNCLVRILHELYNLKRLKPKNNEVALGAETDKDFLNNFDTYYASNSGVVESWFELVSERDADEAVKTASSLKEEFETRKFYQAGGACCQLAASILENQRGFDDEGKKLSALNKIFRAMATMRSMSEISFGESRGNIFAKDLLNNHDLAEKAIMADELSVAQDTVAGLRDFIFSSGKTTEGKRKELALFFNDFLIKIESQLGESSQPKDYSAVCKQIESIIKSLKDQPFDLSGSQKESFDYAIAGLSRSLESIKQIITKYS